MTPLLKSRGKAAAGIAKFIMKYRPLLPSSNVSSTVRLLSDTVDPKEMDHMSQLASRWWDTEGPVKGLHTYNLIRVPFIRDSLVTVTPDTPLSTCLRGKKILEVGCGAGILSEHLAKLGCELTGIDPCENMIKEAIKHSTLNTNLTNKPTYIQTTIEEHIKENYEKYDAIIASEVIEHINIAKREFFVETCVKAVKPGGKIIFTTPNRTRLSQLLGIHLVEGLHVIPRGTHHYHKFITPDELKYLLELNDCHVDHVQGYIYYFWSNSWKWINSQSLMFAMRAVKLNKNA